MPSPRRSLRALVLLLATVLAVPLTSLVGVAPAHAVPGAASGSVSDSLGDALNGVTVTALAAPAFTTSAGQTTTAGGGAYTLPLAEGSYRLQFAKTGYTTALYGGSEEPLQVDVDDEGQLSVDGEPLEGNELEEVQLSSTQTYSVTGVVQNAGSTPLTGIHVAAYHPGDEEDAVATATTNGSGAYTLTLSPGVYHVRYTDPGSTYVPAWYDGTGTEPDDVTVTGNRTLTTVRLATPPADAEFPIAGAVVDANGDPVSGVDVSVTPIGGSTDSGTGTTAPEGDDAGRYTVSVKPGTYRVAFAKTGWVSTRYGGQTTPATVTVGPTGALSASAGEPLVANQLNDVLLVSNPYAVTGLVQVSGDTTPIADITVRAFPTGSTDAGDVVDTDTTDSTGSYTLNLPVGTYDLEYVDDVPTPTTYSSTSLVEVQVGQGGALKVGGTAVDALDPVKLSLSSADTTHPVLGSVIDVNGAEIDGLSVSAVPQGAGTGDVDESGDDGAAGAHGRYRLQLKPGSYEIHVAGGADWENATYQGGGDATAVVTVAANGTISVNATPIAGRDLGETEVAGKTEYALSGTVTDGTTGLPGITVKAYREGDLTTAVASTTSTGATGAWSLSGVDGLVVGTYVVEFSGASGANTYDKAWYGGATATPVEIAQGGVAKVAGVPVAENRLGAITVSRSSADTPHPVTGEVTDANDDPLDGVTVTAKPQTGTPSGNQVAVQTGADGELGDHGRYRLLLKPGTYRVTYTRSGFTDATYPGGDQTPVDVKVNLDGTVLIGTTPSPEAELAPVELADATGDAVLSGRVVSGGAGVNGITVEVFPYGDVSGTPVATTTTATNAGTLGAWSVNTLKIGTYTVRFTDKVADANTYIQTFLGGSELGTAAPVKVGQGNAVTVATVPAPGGTVGETEMAKEGTDTTYPVVGELLDEAGDPIDGATVTATPQNGSGTLASAVTGADGELGDHGRYRLLLKVGTYRLTFAKTGFTTAVYPGAGEPEVLVTVASGGIVTPATLESMTLADAVGDATISGRVVTGSTPTGVAGIVAEVFPAGDLAPESRVGFSAATTASGAWSVSGLRIGEYTVRFTDNGAAAPAYVQTYYGGATLAESTPVKVGQGNAVSVNDVPKAGGALGDTTLSVATADTTYPLSGDVADANGDPLSGVSVSVEVVTPGAAVTPVLTDDEGAYALALRAGTYRIKFTRTGFATAYLLNGDGATAQVVVAVGGAVSIVGGDPVPGGALEGVTLRGTTTYDLTGRVLGAGNPLAGITVRARNTDTEVPAIATTTAANGTFTLKLPVGTYTIEYVGRAVGGTTWDGTFYGGTTTPTSIKVANDGTLSEVDGEVLTSGLEDVVLAKSTGVYAIRGTVSDQTGEPLAGAVVRAFKAGTGTQAGVGTSDAEGAFTINVPVGRYNLRYEKAGKATTWLLNADADTPTYAVVTVAAGGAITAPGVGIEAGVLEDVQLLLPAPRMVAAPKVSGKVLVGRTITTSLGTWSPDFRSTPGWQDYVTIEWFIDGRPADDYSDGDLFEKFAIPAVAGGRTVSYRITIEDPNPDGATRAPIVFTSKGIKVPKAKPKLVATYKGGKLTVVVKVPGLKRPLGSIVVKDGKKKVGATTLKAKNKGKVVVKLKKLKKGKRKLTITYSGDANVAPVKATVKIKV
ncbi:MULTISPECIES: beta strand repeat-containing protein [unclassified Nocardioides]|uniref:beta strand repeat-containing protein n=1 Tax=unclassified Nocardioides TaxID=2615069 RepID=UPI003014B389